MTGPERQRRALQDIAEQIALATEFVGGRPSDAFVADIRSVYAVVRCLEIISEASRRLSDDLKARHALIPWSDIAAAGNIYRQEYQGVSSLRVWSTVETALPPLLRAVEQEL